MTDELLHSLVPAMTVEAEEDTEPKCGVKIVIDTSVSIARHLSRVQKGIEILLASLCDNPLARRRTEVAIMSISPQPQILVEYSRPDRIKVPKLRVTGGSPICSAAEQAVDAALQRRQYYVDHGIDAFKSWDILISDGFAEDRHLAPQVYSRVEAAENDEQLAFWPVAVDERCDYQLLSSLAVREVEILENYSFELLFEYIGRSVCQQTQLSPSQSAKLPPRKGITHKRTMDEF